jgi:hypothetical protein
VRDIPDVYTALAPGLFGKWALVLSVLIAATIVVSSSQEEQTPRESPRIPDYELIAALTTLLIPVWAIFIGFFVSGAFVPRYAMSALVGLFVVVPVGIARIRGALPSLILCLFLVTAFLYAFRDVRPTAVEVQNPMTYRPLLTTALSQSTPVVVTGTLYLQIWYYATPENRSWLSYVAEPSVALRLIGTDTLERDYLVLRDWCPVQVHLYHAFVGQHRRFFLYSVEALTWLPARLREDHAELRELGQESGATMYEVTLR